MYLESIHAAINKLQRQCISPEELQSILPAIGIALSEKDFQKIVPEIINNGENLLTLNF